MKTFSIFVRGILVVSLATALFGCSDRPVLESPIGIVTVDSSFTQLIPAGERLPYVFSDVFGNAEDNQKQIEVALSQKRPEGVEQIASIVADNLPPRPKGTLRVIVTLTISATKELRVKVTITETGYVKEFGPFLVK
jgi:molecular chaperone DnaK (HSP70)